MNESRRQVWRERVEELLESSSPVKDWCIEHEIPFAMMYRWLRTFRDEEPEIFGGYDIAHAGDDRPHWVECVRRARRGEPIEPVSAKRVYEPIEFSSLELSALASEKSASIGTSHKASAAMTIQAGEVTVFVGNDAKEELVVAAVRGVFSR